MDRSDICLVAPTTARERCREGWHTEQRAVLRGHRINILGRFGGASAGHVQHDDRGLARYETRNMARDEPRISIIAWPSLYADHELNLLPVVKALSSGRHAPSEGGYCPHQHRRCSTCREGVFHQPLLLMPPAALCIMTLFYQSAASSQVSRECARWRVAAWRVPLMSLFTLVQMPHFDDGRAAALVETHGITHSWMLSTQR